MRNGAALSVTTMLTALALSRPAPAQSLSSFSFLSDYRPQGVAYDGVNRISPTCEELSALESLEDLENLYASLGFDTSNKAKLLERLSIDWALTLEDKLVSIATSHNRPPAEPLYITLEGVKYGIHGIAHDDKFLKLYEKYFDNLPDSPSTFLSEQNLAPFAPHQQVIELADSAVILQSPRDQPWEEFKYGFLPWTQKESFKRVAKALYPGVPELEGNFRAVILERRHVDVKEWGDICKSLPQAFQELGPFPAPIILDLKRRNNLPLNSVEARSAYMAEVLRRWDGGNKRDLICGAAHSSEIAFFLKNPCTEPEIVEMAQAHANKLNHDKNPNALSPERETGVWVRLGEFSLSATVGLTAVSAFMLYKRIKKKKLSN